MKYIRWIFFGISLAYNLILGIYLKDFLVLSPTLLAFYLLSAMLPLFLLVKIKSKATRIVIYVLLFLIACMNMAYAIYCRRVFPFLAIISLGIILIYFIVFAEKFSKDKLITKIYAMVALTLVLATLFSAYIFVYKQSDVPLTNGQATLWDTKTEKLADEICEDSNTDICFIDFNFDAFASCGMRKRYRK